MTDLDFASHFAKRLNGREYGREITKDEEAIAKSQNLIVCFARSDDLLEIRGVVYDEFEFSAGDGATIYVWNGKTVDEPNQEDRETFAKYGIKFDPQISIIAIWQPDVIYSASWLIAVKGVESYPFDIMEDGELFCRGAVFEVETCLT